MKRLSLEELKAQYVGRQFNWLTVIDVFRSDKCILMFKCICKCGNETVTRKNYVLSGHTTSCGCYNHSEECYTKYNEWVKNNPDKIKAQAEQYKQWCKNNPDKLIERSLKQKQTYKDNPDLLVNRGKQFSEWCKNNPDKVKIKSTKQSISLYNSTDHSYLENYKDIIHPDDYKLALTRLVPLIRIQCPKCGKYEQHPFSNVFINRTKSLKPGRSVPMCMQCRNSSYASSYES